MGDRPKIWVELCCGSAAVTLKLLGGRHAVPPISYMGSKRGYAVAILGAMGLRSGIGADSVLLCDAGPWAHVWSVLADPAMRDEVAATLRSWSDEDPRALWERLREEHRGTWEEWTAERAAGWLTLNGWAAHGKDANSYGGPGREHKASCCALTMPGLAHRTTALAPILTPPPHVHAGRAEEIDPVAVGAWLLRTAWSGGGRVQQYQGPDRPSACHEDGWVACIERDGLATRVETSASGAPSIYAGPAEDLHPIPPLDGVYVYIDPPYQGTTGYAADMPRDTVLDVARRWSDAGAVVCVSEAEPLPLDGWHHVEITVARVGQKRTFSRQQAEWLTMNREPAYRPAVQRSLF